MSASENLITIAKNEQRVYDAGYEKGKAEGEAFLNAYQSADVGNDYRYRFSGYGWTDATFAMIKVPLDGIKITNAINMFAYSKITDIDYDLDYSEAVQINYAFSNAAKLKRIKSITFPTAAASTTNPFTGCSALEDITVKGTINFDLSFSACSKLTAASAESIINAYEAGDYTLDLAAATIALLSDEIKQVAADKGLTIK